MRLTLKFSLLTPMLMAGLWAAAGAQPVPDAALETNPGAQVAPTPPATEDADKPVIQNPQTPLPAALPDKPVTGSVVEETDDKDLPSLPKDVVLPPDQTVLQYLLKHGYFTTILPDGLFKPNAPMTRGEFATLLYRASALNTPFVSEFPYFRDVATTHPAYRAIEALRMRHISQGGTDGYYRPEAPITRATAAGMLSRSFGAGWLTLTPEEINETYKAYGQDPEKISTAERVDIARIVYTGYLLPMSIEKPKTGSPTWDLALNAPLTRIDAARMIFRRTQVTEREKRPELRENIWLPADVTFTVTPTTAISSEQLAVGSPLFFATDTVVEIKGTDINLPRGTRLRGKVVQISLDRLNADVALDRVSLPSGEAYNTASSLTLVFKVGDKKTPGYIVPGQDYTITTRPAP